MTTPLPDARADGASWQDISQQPGALSDMGREHRVDAIRQWRNDSGAGFTDWRARCGAEGVTSFDGSIDRRGRAAVGRRSACVPCWGRL